jgi:hypothetical protein
MDIVGRAKSYKRKGSILILFKIPLLLLTIIFINPFPIPSQAFAKSKYGKSMPISININTYVAYESGCHKVVSNFKANIKGTADLIEEAGESLRYSSKNLTTSYEFKEDHVEICDDKCLGKIVEQRFGSGNARLENFLLDIFLGQTGTFAWIASQGKAPTPEELKTPKDVYQTMMVAEGRYTIKTKSNQACELGAPKSVSLPIQFSVGMAEIKPWGAKGSYTWKGDYKYKDEEVSLAVTDPVTAPQKIYQVSWTFGEVKPVECSLKAVCQNAQRWYECALPQISNIFGLIARGRGIAIAENATYQAMGLPESPGYTQLMAGFSSLEQRIVTFQTNVSINQAQSQGECEQLSEPEDQKECSRAAKSVEEGLKKIQETLGRDIETEITKFEGSTTGAAGSAARSTVLAGLQATLAQLQWCQ